jgi:hypothetical protein
VQPSSCSGNKGIINRIIAKVKDGNWGTNGNRQRHYRRKTIARNAIEYQTLVCQLPPSLVLFVKLDLHFITVFIIRNLILNTSAMLNFKAFAPIFLQIARQN